MDLKRESFPKYVIPLFMLWVFLCNVGTIGISIYLYITNVAIFRFRPGLLLGIVIGINLVSIILLYPLFNMDPIKPFLIPALIWFVVVAAVYIIFGLYWLLIFSILQMFADLWFELMYRKALKKQES
ncbi:MAG: hypothetical protein JW776_10585 [Candidatus Lokiarchaeota archaeon]|nr:hypothetical protein [Candidatus Lokiarchaeota archaeon]